MTVEKTMKFATLDQIKQLKEQDPTNADPAQGDTVGKIKAETDSTKLKQFLNNLGTE